MQSGCKIWGYRLLCETNGFPSLSTRAHTRNFTHISWNRDLKKLIRGILGGGPLLGL